MLGFQRLCAALAELLRSFRTPAGSMLQEIERKCFLLGSFVTDSKIREEYTRKVKKNLPVYLNTAEKVKVKITKNALTITDRSVWNSKLERVPLSMVMDCHVDDESAKICYFVTETVSKRFQILVFLCNTADDCYKLVNNCLYRGKARQYYKSQGVAAKSDAQYSKELPSGAVKAGNGSSISLACATLSICNEDQSKNNMYYAASTSQDKEKGEDKNPSYRSSILQYDTDEEGFYKKFNKSESRERLVQRNKDGVARVVVGGNEINDTVREDVREDTIMQVLTFKEPLSKQDVGYESPLNNTNDRRSSSFSHEHNAACSMRHRGDGSTTPKTARHKLHHATYQQNSPCDAVSEKAIGGAAPSIDNIAIYVNGTNGHKSNSGLTSITGRGAEPENRVDRAIYSNDMDKDYPTKEWSFLNGKLSDFTEHKARLCIVQSDEEDLELVLQSVNDLPSKSCDLLPSREQRHPHQINAAIALLKSYTSNNGYYGNNGYPLPPSGCQEACNMSKPRQGRYQSIWEYEQQQQQQQQQQQRKNGHTATEIDSQCRSFSSMPTLERKAMSDTHLNDCESEAMWCYPEASKSQDIVTSNQLSAADPLQTVGLTQRALSAYSEPLNNHPLPQFQRQIKCKTNSNKPTQTNQLKQTNSNTSFSHKTRSNFPQTYKSGHEEFKRDMIQNGESLHPYYPHYHSEALLLKSDLSVPTKSPAGALLKQPVTGKFSHQGSIRSQHWLSSNGYLPFPVTQTPLSRSRSHDASVPISKISDRRMEANRISNISHGNHRFGFQRFFESIEQFGPRMQHNHNSHIHLLKMAPLPEEISSTLTSSTKSVDDNSSVLSSASAYWLSGHHRNNVEDDEVYADKSGSWKFHAPPIRDSFL